MTSAAAHFARVIPPEGQAFAEHAREVAACFGKEQYANGQLAAAVARRRNRNADVRRNVEHYRCPHCGWFHLGRPARRRGR